MNDHEQERLALLNETLAQLDWLAGEEPRTQSAVRFTVGLLFVTRFAGRLAELLDIDIYEAAIWYYRLRCNGVVCDEGPLRIDWECGDIAVLLDAMVAMGKLSRSWGDGGPVYALRDEWWKAVPLRGDNFLERIVCNRCHTPQLVRRRHVGKPSNRMRQCVGCQTCIFQQVNEPSRRS